MKFKMIMELVNENGERIGLSRFATDVIEVADEAVHLTSWDTKHALEKADIPRATAIDAQRERRDELLGAATLMLQIYALDSLRSATPRRIR